MQEAIKPNFESDKNPYTQHPRSAQKIVGHELAKDKFMTSYRSGKLHHAWLIYGPKGVGKATLAWQMAKYLLSDNTFLAGSTYMSKETISHRIEALSEPAIHLCRKQFDKTKKRYFQDISIDEIRKINHFFSLSSTQSSWRVVIIDSVDDLSNSAANALLKALEEPPKGGLFFLICENKENLLPTIISRCQLLKCGFLKYNEFDQVLKELQVFEKEKIDIKSLFSITNGSISKAINFTLNDGFNIFKEIANIISFNKKMDRKKIWHLINKNNSSLGQKEYYLFIQELLLLVLSRTATVLAKKENKYPTSEEKKINDIYIIYSNSYSVFSYLYLELTNDFSIGNKLNSDPENIILEAFLKIEEALQKMQS